MNRRLYAILLAVMFALLLGVGGAIAQGPEGEDPSGDEGDVSIAAVVNSRISYQAVLRENGSLVTGNRNMVFSLYSNSSCTTLLQTIPKNNVPVNNGLFDVKLDVTHSNFDGQEVWLRVEVEGSTIVSCEEIVPVPYALSLRPGAIIDDEGAVGTALQVIGDFNTTSGHITTGNPTSPGGLSANDISSTDDLLADDIIRAGDRVIAGLPSSLDAAGDVVADNDLVADEDVLAGGNIISGGGRVSTGVPLGPGGISDGDIASTDDVIADDIVHAGNDVIADDDVIAFGTKSALIQTSFGARRAYAIEAADVRLVDQGQGQLQGGVTSITLDPIFLDMVTIDEGHPMLVQLTLTSDVLGLYVAEKTASGFTVRELQGGTSNATFDWQVSAIRKDYEDTRLEQLGAEPQVEGSNQNDPVGAVNEDLSPVSEQASGQGQND